MCDYLKYGKRASIARAEVEHPSDFCDALEQHATWVNAKGKELKTYQITDCMAIMYDMEKAILNRKMPDYNIIVKLKFQREYMGFIATTGNEADRPLLLVNECYPVKRKKDGKQFGYSIIAQSIGSGKITRFTVFNRTWESCGEIKPNNVVRCDHYERDGQYFRMTKYTVL